DHSSRHLYLSVRFIQFLILVSAFHLLLILFFLHSFFHHRSLHSFPTRRSSDLPQHPPSPSDRNTTEPPDYSSLRSCRTAATCGTIARSALPRWLMRSFSSSSSSAVDDS